MRKPSKSAKGVKIISGNIKSIVSPSQNGLIAEDFRAFVRKDQTQSRAKVEVLPSPLLRLLPRGGSLLIPMVTFFIRNHSRFVVFFVLLHQASNVTIAIKSRH